MDPNHSDAPPPQVSRRAARWILALCGVLLLGSLAAFAYLGLSQWRSSTEDGERIVSAAAGMSFVAPQGWDEVPQEGDDRLVYGQVALSKPTGEGMILLGKLDDSLFAAAESDDARAACSLASGMGEFFFPESGERVDRESKPVKGAEVTGDSCYYRVEFSSGDPDAEVYAAVVRSGDQRWWLTWLGNATVPVDRQAAHALAESIRPL
ncbi:APA family fibronectin-binding glycoprotein [Nocardia sp. NPDC050406]|uniref:APA family fibronectin-binding glycoprotein n=1 Tax=Nocardia sp. NPDC050406 TaxID=3364318 RepID=UPI003798E3EB